MHMGSPLYKYKQENLLIFKFAKITQLIKQLVRSGDMMLWIAADLLRTPHGKSKSV
jgi:hypothetical protein